MLNPGVTPPRPDNLAAAWRTALGAVAETQQRPRMDPDDESPAPPTARRYITRDSAESQEAIERALLNREQSA